MESDERRTVKYREKSLLTEATQWSKDGDHSEVHMLPSPDESDNPYCSLCGNLMQRHGLLDGVNGEEIICPNDYIVDDRNGLPYRLSRGQFESQYEPYVRPPRFTQTPTSDIEERKRRRRTKA